MLCHYRHYSDLYASGEMFDLTETERYTAFGPYRKRVFDVHMAGVADGAWQMKEYRLNREHDSAFDTWVEMGAQPLASREEVEQLCALSRPMLRRAVLTAQGGRGMPAGGAGAAGGAPDLPGSGMMIICTMDFCPAGSKNMLLNRSRIHGFCMR